MNMKHTGNATMSQLAKMTHCQTHFYYLLATTAVL